LKRITGDLGHDSLPCRLEPDIIERDLPPGRQKLVRFRR
jgi:hypothetical protein